ncbi:MAG: hypothetical protein JW714_03305 [Candidatus Omnitrophica bacterium]|nr:hypothetical protein [Candidatus Omnitrophota bacterium]
MLRLFISKDDVKLAPQQTITFAVKVKDVWRIPEVEINQLREKTSYIIEQLEKTDYYAKSREKADSIYEHLDNIAKSQNDDAVSRSEHIDTYRSNVEVVEKIKEDIVEMERLSKELKKPLAEVESLRKNQESLLDLWAE